VRQSKLPWPRIHRADFDAGWMHFEILDAARPDPCAAELFNRFPMLL